MGGYSIAPGCLVACRLVPSTVIRTFKYEPDSNRLLIQFQSGRRYAYFDVPPDVYAALRRANSRGSYFNKWVRDRYPYAQLESAEQ
jgi:hypothetical protein